MNKEHKHFVGKVSSRLDKAAPRNCAVYLTWGLKDGTFSMCGEVWNHIKTDIIMGGQCVDTIAELFPHNKRVQRMAEIWKRWHLNDLKAGSKAQEDYLREHPMDPASYAYPKSHYTVACEYLAAAGLNPDPDGYEYGTAWKREELPPDVVAEIQSWSAPA